MTPDSMLLLRDRHSTVDREKGGNCGGMTGEQLDGEDDEMQIEDYEMQMHDCVAAAAYQRAPEKSPQVPATDTPMFIHDMWVFSTRTS